MQIAIHAVLGFAPLLVLPLHLPAGWTPPAQTSPVTWILAMLSVAVGLPFFLLAASTPMLQRWFSQSGHASGSDPYFLYAASNAGSLVGLLSYPLVVEPSLRLSMQSAMWSYGYIAFALLTVVCASLSWPSKADPGVREPAHAVESTRENEKRGVTGVWRERLRWIALAFVPSSLMLGTTTAITTDLPSIPLFWVLPLALYLLSFVLVFARRPLVSRQWLVRRQPLLMLGALVPAVSKTKFPLSVELPVYLCALFVTALVCHGELARNRPKITRLTEFYLLLSVGGALGGVFNSLLAPILFSTVLEFPLVMVAAAFLRPRIEPDSEPGSKAAMAKRKDWLFPVAFGICLLLVIAILTRGLAVSRPLGILIFGSAMAFCLTFGKRPLRFALGLIALLLAGSTYSGSFGEILHTERSFFGVSRVSSDPGGRFRYLFHGGTIHGIEYLDPAHNREPLGYYNAEGPAGSIVRAMHARTATGAVQADANWAIVGLGSGAMACFLAPGESVTYYEIDPAVRHIATDPRYFNYLNQCAANAAIVMGDARLRLRDSADGSYDLIVIDAFSGDMIPTHLMTREALALYLRKLKPNGVLAFHISNLYLDLAPTLGALARDAGLECLLDDDATGADARIDSPKFPSRWMVMAHNPGDLGSLASNARWKPPQVPPETRVWTDDYSNLLHVIRWN
jgi:SAM-dependent methyltransferase